MNNKTLRNFQSLYSFDCICGEFVYNICNLIDFLELNDTEYFESGKVISQFAKTYNLSIYSSPKETFSITEALSLVEREKTSGVIVEDLS